MCNLFSNTAPAEAMRRLFDVAPERDRLGNAEPRPSIFPRGDTPVVRRDADGGRSLALMSWGFLIPQTSRRTGRPILPKAITNARDDKLRESAFWRESFDSRRCLIPGTSFCESLGFRPAVYHWFAVRGDGARPLFAFAGLWRRWRGLYRGETVDLDTVTMVTTRPNALVATVHPDRMPAILPPENWETWLSGPPDEALDLIGPFDADAMRIVRKGPDEKADPAPQTESGAQ